MIYCGYQGIGKSTYCRSHTDTTIDLDSSNFVKVPNWEIQYVDVALKLSNQGYDVFISAHPCVIERLIDIDGNLTQFKVIVPNEKKDAWQARLWLRYYQKPTDANLRAVSDFIQHWDDDSIYYYKIEQMGVTVLRVNAKVQTNLVDLI